MKFTVIGNPIAHSLSPLIHQEFAKQFNLTIEYTKIEAPLEKFKETVHLFQVMGGTGVNITLPFKQEAFNLAHHVSERAQQAEAANTLKFNSNGMIEADNTDGVGFIADIQLNQNFSLANKNILILGAGGAVRGILPALLETAPNKIVIANRTLITAIQLAEKFNNNQNILSCRIPDILGEFDLVIDAISFSSWPLELPSTLSLSSNSMVYDLKYQPQPTAIMSWALQNGAKSICDGIGMLVEQAAESFYYWTQLRPTTTNIIAELKKKIPNKN